MLDYSEYLSQPGNFRPPDRVVAIDTPDLDPPGLSAGVFEPQGEVATVLVWLHGGGARRDGYAGLAASVRERSRTAVVTPDLRGHGGSAGERGYAPSETAVWRDIDAVLAWASGAWPGAAIVLGGHSSGAGLALNWASRVGGDKPKIEGLILLAPMLGGGQSGFAKASPWMFAVWLMSGRRWFGHSPAVRFLYPADAPSGRVSHYTPGMAMAVTPRNAAGQLSGLSLPRLILLAEADELFPLDIQSQRVGEAAFDVVPGSHLSCIPQAASRIAEFLERVVSGFRASAEA